MICSNCGTWTDEGSTFCIACGQQFARIPYAQYQQPYGSNGGYGQTPNDSYYGGNSLSPYNTYNGGNVQVPYNSYNDGNVYNDMNVQSESSGNVFNSTQPQKNNTVPIIIISVVAGIAVIAGIVFAILYFTGNDDKNDKKSKKYTEIVEDLQDEEDDDDEDQEIEVTFTPYNDGIYIEAEQAELASEISIEDGEIEKWGCRLYTASKKAFGKHEERYDQSTDSDCFIASIMTSDDMGPLDPDTTYYYRFYVITEDDEEKIYDKYRSFTTSKGSSDVPYELREYEDGLVPENEWYIVNTKKATVNVRSKPEYNPNIKPKNDPTIIKSVPGGTRFYVEYIYNDVWAVTYDNGRYVFISMYNNANINNSRILVLDH